MDNIAYVIFNHFYLFMVTLLFRMYSFLKKGHIIVSSVNIYEVRMLTERHFIAYLYV